MQPISTKKAPAAIGPYSQAVVVTVGGGIRRYDIAGQRVLDGYDESAVCDGARGQQLVPWPNRVRDGKWTWQGQHRQLNLTEPEQQNAIHGLARWSDWQVEEVDEASVRLGLRIPAQPGWDWSLDVTSTHRLGPDGLTVTTTISNRGDSPAPCERRAWRQSRQRCGWFWNPLSAKNCCSLAEKTNCAAQSLHVIILSSTNRFSNAVFREAKSRSALDATRAGEFLPAP